MKRTQWLFVVFSIVLTIDATALDIGARFENAPGIMGTKPFFADSTAVIMDLGFTRGPVRIGCFGGAGFVPWVDFGDFGERRTPGFFAIPLIGIEGGYSFPLGGSAFSLPIGLECRAAFPSAEIARTSASVALSSRTGVRAAFGALSLNIAAMIELASIGFDGSLATYLDRHLMGLSCGLSYSLR